MRGKHGRIPMLSKREGKKGSRSKARWGHSQGKHVDERLTHLQLEPPLGMQSGTRGNDQILRPGHSSCSSLCGVMLNAM